MSIESDVDGPVLSQCRAGIRGEVVAMGCAHDQGYWTQVFGRRMQPGQRK